MRPRSPARPVSVRGDARDGSFVNRPGWSVAVLHDADPPGLFDDKESFVTGGGGQVEGPGEAGGDGLGGQ